MKMLNCLATFVADITHQSPSAIRVAGRRGELRRNGVHARKERRMLRRVAKISGRANMFARNDQQMQWRLWRNVLKGDDKVGGVVLRAWQLAGDDATEETISHASILAQPTRPLPNAQPR